MGRRGIVIQGTVRRVIPDRGFGFVAALDGTEYFFHRTGAADFEDLRPGDAVTFLPGEGAKGPRAELVERRV